MTLTTDKSFRAFRPHAKPGLHAPRASLFSTFGIFIDFKQLRNSSKNRFPNKTVLGRFRRAVPFPTGSQNHTFEDKLAPRPSQNLKNYGFRPVPKNTPKIATRIDAFSRPRTTFSIGKQTVSWVLAFYVKVKKNMPGDTPKVMLFRQKVRQRRHQSDLFYLFGLIEKSSIFHRFPIVPPTPTGVDFMWKVGSAGYPKNVQISKIVKKSLTRADPIYRPTSKVALGSILGAILLIFSWFWHPFWFLFGACFSMDFHVSLAGGRDDGKRANSG